MVILLTSEIRRSICGRALGLGLIRFSTVCHCLCLGSIVTEKNWWLSELFDDVFCSLVPHCLPLSVMKSVEWISHGGRHHQLRLLFPARCLEICFSVSIDRQSSWCVRLGLQRVIQTCRSEKRDWSLRGIDLVIFVCTRSQILYQWKVRECEIYKLC